MKKEIAQKHIDFFEKHYDLSIMHLNESRKLYIGKKGECRFCGKKEPETTFKNIAHSFPEFLGNTTLISSDECDSCNKLFSETIEDNFAKYTLIDRALMQISGKSRKPPTYKREDVRIERKDGQIKIQSHINNKDILLDVENNRLTITGYKQPYTPRLAFKCLVKMALAVMPSEELQHFGDTLLWLQIKDRNDDKLRTNSLICIQSFVPGPMPFPWITYLLFKRKDDNDNIPYSIFYLAVGNYTFQIHIPGSRKDAHLEGKDINLPFFPNVFGETTEFGEVNYFTKNLSSNEQLQNAPSITTMRFLNLKKIQ